MYDPGIEALIEIVRACPERNHDLGVAIRLLKFAKKYRLSPRDDKVTRLPDVTTAFGCFTVQECDEMGNPLRVLTDEAGNPLEFLPGSLVIEQVVDLDEPA